MRPASCGQRQRREVRAPAADARERRARHREEREVRSPGDVPAQPDDLRRLPDPLVRVERSRLEDAHELRVVLAHYRSRRDRVGGLVALALRQCRAVDGCEEREAETDDEERHSDRGPARIAREREGGQPEGKRASPAGALEQLRDEADGACRQDGGDEDDETGEEEQDGSGSLSAGQAAGVGRAARERDGDHDGRSGCGEVERREAEPAQLDAGRPHRGEQDRGGGDDERDRNGQAGPGKDRMHDDLRARRSEVIRDRERRDDPGEPPDRRPGRGDRRGLGARLERDLGTRRAEPRQAAPARLRVPTQPRRGQDDERQQQRGSLAAEQQEPALSCLAGCAEFLQVLLGRFDGERGRDGADRRSRLGQRPVDAAEVPRVDVARLERDDPAVAAVVVEQLRQPAPRSPRRPPAGTGEPPAGASVSPAR